MGLDMYLYRRSYVQNWEHYKPEERHSITVKRGNNVREDIKPERIAYITEQVAYWRKFNALHGWFIQNCADGEDNCQEIYVSEDDLKTLLETLKQVKDAINKGNESQAEKLLPPMPGFFFGSTEIDDYYKEEIEDTIQIIENLLNEDSTEDYYYQASW